MRRFSFYIPVALLTFGVSSFIAFNLFWHKEKQIDAYNTQEIEQEASIGAENSLPQINKIVFNDDCEKWNEKVDYRLIIEKWLRGENLRKVPYCSENGKEAENYSPSNITPTLIDLNGDGKDELAVQSLCSPTGNCVMEIFEKVNEGYRKIFSNVHSVNRFELGKISNKGFRDISTKMHGSWNSGDGVIYKYNGKRYKPHRCFYYEYEQYTDEVGETKAKDIPTITYEKCSAFF